MTAERVLARAGLVALALASGLRHIEMVAFMFSDSTKERLKGTRVSVLALDRNLEPDPALARVRVALARARC